MRALEGRLFTSFTRSEWRMFLFAADERPRRHRWASTLRWLRWEAWLLTRLPGDVVFAMDRDCVYLIHGGRPGHLRGWRISGQAISSHAREWRSGDDLWPLIAHNPRESWLPNVLDVHV